MRWFLLVILLVLWLSVVACGMAFVWSYNHKPGAPAAAPLHWPVDSAVRRASDHYTMVMLAHPKCPCTRASVEEMSKLMAHCQGRLTTYVLFVKPKDSPKDWNKTDLWNSAAIIPGVSVLVDEDGTEARRFGGATSGQVLLYDQNGALVFRGGITESRGHIGDNAGRSAVESLVNRGLADRDKALVFGCPLFDPDLECKKPDHAKASN